MIESLTNTYFYLLLILFYLIILNYALKQLRFYEYINNSKFTGLIKSRLSSIKYLAFINEIITKRIMPFIRNILSESNKLVLNPALNKTSFFLEGISLRINNAELKSENATSHSISEAIILISLIIRKLVEGSPQISWSAMLALIVLIYFILTV